MEPNLEKMTCSGEWGNSLKKRLGRKVEKPKAPEGQAVEQTRNEYGTIGG